MLVRDWPQVMVRLSPGTLERIDRECEARCLSRTALVGFAVEAGLAQLPPLPTTTQTP
jgi:hypothetical protein